MISLCQEKTYRYGLPEHYIKAFLDKICAMTTDKEKPLIWKCLNISPENYDNDKFSQMSGIVKYRTEYKESTIMLTVSSESGDCCIEVLLNEENSYWREIEIPTESTKAALRNLVETVQKLFLKKTDSLEEYFNSFW